MGLDLYIYFDIKKRLFKKSAIWFQFINKNYNYLVYKCDKIFYKSSPEVEYMRLRLAKTLPITILVILPIVITLMSYEIDQPTIYVVPELGYEIVPVDVLYIILFIYAFFPIIYSTEKYFKRFGLQNSVEEYIYIIKILYVIIPLVVIVFLIERVFWGNILSILFPFNPLNQSEWTSTIQERYVFDKMIREGYYLFPIGINLAYPVIAGIIRITIQRARRDFRFYFARSCFVIANEAADKTIEVKYLVMGIKWYDKYLQRIMNLCLKDLTKIYSELLSSNTSNKNGLIYSLVKAFENKNKLEPAKILVNILSAKGEKDFLVDQSLGQRIKAIGIFLATIVPVIIAVVQLLLPGLG